jgi:pimeloyl-ACP methyl ester carboxylesterase
MSGTATQQPESARLPPTASRPRRRLLRGTLWLVAGLAGVGVLAVAVTAVLDARDARRYPAPGDLVELGDGRDLHLYVAGEETGGTTVVLDAGHGGFSPVFAWLQQELATTTAVVAYDRPGYGWSDRADRPVSADATAADLHEALATRGLPGPYILVGHSLGSHYVRTFADRYPDDVIGLVLLDPAHEDQFEQLPDASVAQMEQMGQVAVWAARLARLGVFRIHNPQDAVIADLPAADAEWFGARSLTAAYWRATADEGLASMEAIPTSVPADLAAVPTRIVSAPVAEAGEEEARQVMDRLHRDLASRSPLAEHVEVPGAGHLTILTEQEHAAAVGRIVTDLLTELGRS